MKLVYYLQRISTVADRFVQPFYISLFRRYGLVYFSFIRTPSVDVDEGENHNENAYDAFLSEVATLLQNGVEIRVSLGEMGHSLIDSQTILQALQHAYTKNSASIEIIHGPHVDPETTGIFTLARRKVVQLFQVNRYVPHHFLVIKDRAGRISFADENPHNEALWKADGGASSGYVKTYRSVWRVWYLGRASVDYGQYLLREFNHRQDRSEKTDERPDASHDYRFVTLRILGTSIRNALFRAILQPFRIVIDQVQLNILQRVLLLTVLALISGIRVIALICSFAVYTVISMIRFDRSLTSNVQSIRNMSSKENAASSTIKQSLDRILSSRGDTGWDTDSLSRLRQLVIMWKNLAHISSNDVEATAHYIISRDETLEYLDRIIGAIAANPAVRESIQEESSHIVTAIESDNEYISTYLSELDAFEQVLRRQTVSPETIQIAEKALHDFRHRQHN